MKLYSILHGHRLTLGSENAACTWRKWWEAVRSASGAHQVG